MIWWSCSCQNGNASPWKETIRRLLHENTREYHRVLGLNEVIKLYAPRLSNSSGTFDT